MNTKRVKISNDTFNQGKITVISRSEISETNKRVKEEMRDVVRDYEKKETLSEKEAAKLVLNA